MSAFSSTRVARNAMCLVLLASVSACAGTREPTYPVPDEPGIYSFTTKDNLRRLDGDREWEVETWPERSNMPSNVHFVINEPALAGRSAGNSVELWRVAWVRSEINPQGQAMPIQGSEWAVAPLAPFAIPFRYESPPGQTDIVHIVPTVPLEPGLYTLRIANPGARQARGGVGWARTPAATPYAPAARPWPGRWARTSPARSSSWATSTRPTSPTTLGTGPGSRGRARFPTLSSTSTSSTSCVGGTAR